MKEGRLYRIGKDRERRNLQSAFVGYVRISFAQTNFEILDIRLDLLLTKYQSTIKMSDSGVSGPTPEGTDLSQTQNTAISSAVISLMVIATIFVLLRLFARTMQKCISLAVDDYCIALGLVSLIQYACLISTNHCKAFCSRNGNMLSR